MKEVDCKNTNHPSEGELASFMSGTLTKARRKAVIEHLGGCPECLAKVVAADEAVSSRDDTGQKTPSWWRRLTGTSPYLIGAIIAFALSFILPRFFMQFLVATIILGIKWIVDAKSTKMLIMIYEAWKKGGDKEAGKALETFEKSGSRRL